MSGVEIAIAVSLVAAGAGAYGQITAANQAAELQAKQLREQQVQLRLQENQASLERMRKLEAVLATEEVMLGSRNISAGSGTANAFTISNMSHFYEDENADKLNYGAKQLALGRQIQLVQKQRKAQVFNAITGAISQGASTALMAYGVPSKSLIDASSGAGTANVGGSYGGQQYMSSQRNQFNLNR